MPQSMLNKYIFKATVPVSVPNSSMLMWGIIEVTFCTSWHTQGFLVKLEMLFFFFTWKYLSFTVAA